MACFSSGFSFLHISSKPVTTSSLTRDPSSKRPLLGASGSVGGAVVKCLASRLPIGKIQRPVALRGRNRDGNITYFCVLDIATALADDTSGPITSIHVSKLNTI